VFDSGKLRDIKVFTMDRGDRQRPSAAVATRANPSEHLFTNSEMERSGPTGVTVILIDSLNTKWTDQSRATRNVIRFLSQIHADDHVAIYSIGLTGFRVLHDFMTDASDLVAQLTSWNGEIPRANTSDLGDQLAIVLSGRDRGATLNQRQAAGAVQRLVEECVFPIQNRLFQGTFHDRMPTSGLCRVDRFRMQLSVFLTSDDAA
jgi:hypothetical protein